MKKETGEVKVFGPEEELPDGWLLIPNPGTEIEFTFKQKLGKGAGKTIRRRRAKVIEVQEGKPGRLLIEMLPMK